MGGRGDAQRGRGAGARARMDGVLDRVRELRASDAFEPPEQTGAAISPQAAKADARRDSRRCWAALGVSLGVLLVVGLLGLCIPASTTGGAGNPVAPADALAYWALQFKVSVVSLFDTSIVGEEGRLWAQFAAEHPGVDMDGLGLRAWVTLAVIACGCMLACAGLLFQTAFKNPLATPSILGVSDGVTLGSLLFVALGNYSISQAPELYMLCVYGCGAATLLAVLLLSRVVSGRRANVFDMLLVGTVIAQLLSGINGYVTNFGLDAGAWASFYTLQQAYDALAQPVTYRLVAIFFVLTVVPALALRFRLNLIAFDDGESRMSGVRPAVLRGLALVLGSAMQLVAMASIGQVAMLSLVVPFLVRYLLPSDFRWQLLGNCVIGSIALLVCSDAQAFLTFGLATMPVGTIVGFAVIPFLLWLVALQRKGW